MSAATHSSCQAGLVPHPSAVISTLRNLSVETWDFINVPVDVLHAPVNPCTFLRQYVATNTPVLIREAIEHWPATHSWSKEYFDAAVGTQEISVELTPSGFGDAVTSYETDNGQTADCFCMPHSSRMPFQQFTAMFFQSKQQKAKSDAAVAPTIPYLSVGAVDHGFTTHRICMFDPLASAVL